MLYVHDEVKLSRRSNHYDSGDLSQLPPNSIATIVKIDYIDGDAYYRVSWTDSYWGDTRQQDYMFRELDLYRRPSDDKKAVFRNNELYCDCWSPNLVVRDIQVQRKIDHNDQFKYCLTCKKERA